MHLENYVTAVAKCSHKIKIKELIRHYNVEFDFQIDRTKGMALHIFFSSHRIILVLKSSTNLPVVMRLLLRLLT